MTGTKLLKVTAEQPAQNLTMVIIFRKSPYIKLGHLRRIQSFPNKLWWLWGKQRQHRLVFWVAAMQPDLHDYRRESAWLQGQRKHRTQNLLKSEWLEALTAHPTMCQPMPSGCKPETVLELPMSVNKAPIEWRQGRIESYLEPLVYP